MQSLIVGYGSIGKRHARNLRRLRPDVEITVLRHRQPEVADQQNDLVDQFVYDIQDALERRPQFAIIASPAPMHVETAICLAKQGVHLLIEKPLSDRLEGIADLAMHCQKQGVTLLVGYTLRFHRCLQVVKQALDTHKIGRLLGIHAEVGQYLPDWRSGIDYRHSVTAQQSLGGGVLLELSHEIDYLRWLVGEVLTLQSMARKVSDLQIDVEDWAEVMLQFESGALGQLHLDMVQRVPVRRGRAIGTEGTLTWDLLAKQVHLQSPGIESAIRLDSESEDKPQEIYEDLLRHFLACIDKKVEPICSIDDGTRVLEIVLAARKAAQTGVRIKL